MASYAQPDITHNATDSGAATSSGTNTAIALTTKGQCVGVTVYNSGATAFTIKMNAETNAHTVPAGKSWCSGYMNLTQFVIVETASEYSYTAIIVAS